MTRTSPYQMRYESGTGGYAVEFRGTREARVSASRTTKNELEICVMQDKLR